MMYLYLSAHAQVTLATYTGEPTVHLIASHSLYTCTKPTKQST